MGDGSSAGRGLGAQVKHPPTHGLKGLRESGGLAGARLQRGDPTSHFPQPDLHR